MIFQTWTPQSDRILEVPAEGGPPAEITEPAEGDAGYADLSPDGLRIAFVVAEGNAERVFIRARGGGAARPLTSAPSSVPRWSPDGRWIAFARDRRLDGGVFLVRPDGTEERRLTDTGGWPVWWPDGSKVAFRAIGEDGNQEIRLVAVSGGSPERLPGIRFAGNNLPIDVSRDGRLLATTNEVESWSEIWLLKPSRGDEERTAPSR